jgi:hypothetical protein
VGFHMAKAFVQPFSTRSDFCLLKRLRLASPRIVLVMMVETQKDEIRGSVVAPIVIEMSHLASLLSVITV